MVLKVADPETESVAGQATTTRIVLVLEYNGTRYHGFQFQLNKITVQEELEKALEKLTGEKIRVAGASRTDAGVHARGQVVSFQTGSSYPLATFITGLNYHLPRDIAVKAAHKVDSSFNVRHRAVSREYNYYILNSLTRSPVRHNYTYQVSGHLDIEAMNRVCQALIGQHDFVSFATGMGGEEKSTVRRVYRAEVKREGDTVIFNIVANAFLPHQVRNTVGALIRVGLGKMSVEEFCSIMEQKRPGLARPAAPARGLCLMRVNYMHPFEEET